MIVKIKYENKTVLTAMAKQYSYYYFMKFADWFDSHAQAGRLRTDP